MKTFKQYNESIKDLMTGISEDDIEKELEGLPDIDKLRMFYKNRLPDKYKPEITKELTKEIKDTLIKELKGNTVNKFGVLWKENKGVRHVIVSANENKLKVWIMRNNKIGVSKILHNYEITWDEISDETINKIFQYYSIIS